MNQLLQRILGIQSDFEYIFFRNEYQTLAGNKFRTVLTLLAILFLTFLALGFAVGSLGNLERKMDNPFTNWVNLDISSNYISNQSGKIIERYNDPSITDQYIIRTSDGFSRYNVEFYHRDFLPFAHPTDTLKRPFWGRTLQPDEPLLNTIIDPTTDNTVWVAEQMLVEEDRDWKYCEIIITTNMMRLLGFERAEEIGNLGLAEERIVLNNSRFTKPIYVPIKVVGVVKELPNVDFISTANLYNALKDKRYDFGKRCRESLISENRAGSSRFQMVCESESKIADLEQLADQFFKNKAPAIELDFTFNSAGRNWAAVRLSFLPIDAPTLDSLYHFIDFASPKVKMGELSSLNCNSNTCSELNARNLGYLAFHFERLDSVKAFRQDLLNEFDIGIDMGQIESKDNFALVSRLTMAISLILLGFGILSIVLFVNNLLRSHLHKVRPNLGTFQAFGLRNNFLVNTYLKIILSFLGLSIAVAFGLAIVVDRIEQWWFGLESRFDLFNTWIVVAIVGLILISLLLSTKTIKQILGDTPGNLIYGR